MNFYIFFHVKYLLFLYLSLYAYNNSIYFKNKVNKLYYLLCWFLLKSYSKIEILHNKLKKNEKLKKKIIKNGTLYYNEDKNYDMILYEINNEDVVRFNNEKSDILDYEQSNIKLIGIEINILENNILKYKYPLLLDKNYFIKDNILFDRKFINYCLKMILKKDIIKLEEKYEVLFFDNNIDLKKINEPEYIKINKDSFEVIKNDIKK